MKKVPASKGLLGIFASIYYTILTNRLKDLKNSLYFIIIKRDVFKKKDDVTLLYLKVLHVILLILIYCMNDNYLSNIDIINKHLLI